jgi:hypothetical protein
MAMMKSKEWYKSKTIQSGAAIILIGLLDLFLGMGNQYTQIAVIIFGGLGVKYRLSATTTLK